MVSSAFEFLGNTFKISGNDSALVYYIWRMAFSVASLWSHLILVGIH
jgi:hypothetical protein